jgi:hypothetical protein
MNRINLIDKGWDAAGLYQVAGSTSINVTAGSVWGVLTA